MQDDEQQRRKRARRTTLDQLEEGRAFSVLETIENETEREESNSASNYSDDEFSSSDDDDEFFYGAGANDFSEIDCYYEYEQEVEEDDIDPDELSYEELLALGEMVGEEKRGLCEDEINQHLHQHTYHPNSPIERCVICQVEYEEGENVVSLHCDHLYHRDCIAQWLQIKKICPICNNELQMSSN